MPPLFERLRRKKHAGPRCSMVVPAAGSSARMEGMDKILLPLGDVPILIRTLQALENCPLVQEIIVVTRQDLIVPAGQLCKDFDLQKVRKLVVGGATRTQSVLASGRPTRQPMSSASTTEPGPLLLRRCWSRSSCGPPSAGPPRRPFRSTTPSSGPQAVWWRRR